MKGTLLNWIRAGGRHRHLIFGIATCLTFAGFCRTGSAASLVWTGNPGGTALYWSNPSNWLPHAIPAAGDTLSFNQGTPQSQFSTNDLANLAVNLQFGDQDVYLYGNAVTLIGGFDHVWNTSIHLSCGLTLGANLAITVGDSSNHGTGSLYLLGDINLNGYQVTLKGATYASAGGNGTGRLYISGAITGSGQVSAGVDEGSYLEFNGPGNSFVGDLFLTSAPSGSIVLNTSPGVVAGGNITIDRSSSNTVTAAGDVYYNRSDQFGDNAQVLVTHGMRLLLNGYSDSIGSLALLNAASDSFASRVDTAGGLLRLAGNLSSTNYNANVIPAIFGRLELLYALHTFTMEGYYYAGLDLQATVSGLGTITKLGSSGVLLSSSNSFISSIIIDQGTVEVCNDHGLGDTSGNTVIGAGNLVLRNVNIGNEAIVASGVGSTQVLSGSVLVCFGTSSCSGPISLNTNLLMSGGDLTLTGPISGPGGLGCFNVATVELGGSQANTYTGPTIAQCTTLRLNKPAGLHAYSGPLIVGSTNGGPYEVRWLATNISPDNGPLTLYSTGLANLSGYSELFGSITFNGGAVQTGAGHLQATGPIYVNAADTTATMDGFLDMNASAFYFIVSNGVADPDLQVNSVIAGQALFKQGDGTLKITGSNTFSSVATIQQGIFVASNPGAFGTSGPGKNPTAVDGGTLLLDGVGTVNELIFLYGYGFGGTNGALCVTNGATLVGGVSLDNGGATIKVLGSSPLVIDSFVTGNGSLRKDGPGPLYLGGLSGGVTNNSYTGDTVVLAGTLYLSKDQNVISVPGRLLVGPGSTSAPPVARWLHSGTMTAGGSALVFENSLLDLNGNNQLLSQLNLYDGGDVATGTGLLSFSSGGSLAVDTTYAPSIGLRASSLVSGNLVLPTDTLFCNVQQYGPAPLTSEPELDISAAISGSGNIQKNGPGAMRLTGGNTFDGTPSVSGGELDVLAGSVIAGNRNALGGTNGVTYVANGASLVLASVGPFARETLLLNSTNLAALDNRGTTNTWNGPIQLLRDSSINVGTGYSLNINNVISGTGNLYKQGSGLMALAGGTNNNSFSGDTFVNNGTVLLNKSAYYQAIPHNLIIGSGLPGAPPTFVRHLALDQIQSSVTINAGGILDVGAFDEYAGYQDAIRLNGGGSIQGTTGTFYLADGANLIVNPAGGTNLSTISGKFGMFPGSHRIIVTNGIAGPSQYDLNIAAPISQFSTLAGLSVEGNGRVRFGGMNTFTGSTAITNATLAIDGSQPQSPVTINNGRLQGTGVVGHITFTGAAGSTIAPGNGPGILSCSNFNASSIGGGNLEIELDGTAPGTGYDQLNVRGTVNLTGLSLQTKLGFLSAANQQFTIIANDGSDPVTGTFAGMAEGAQIWAGSELFQISYTGGTGNDVVLTRLTTPPLVLNFEKLSSTSSRCFWSSNYPTYHLEYTAALGTNHWTVDTNIPAISGTSFSVTNTLTGPQKFYRLSRLE
jgi:autotransporter-associated beta strand protein